MPFPEHVKFYIVGGYVRDRLLGRESHDHDFLVVGSTPEMMLENGFQQVGADFPVFLNAAGDEYALARTEKKVGDGYHGFETVFDPSVTLEQDLSRRDLTINAMAREVVGWNELGHARLSDEIIDPFGGQRDLTERVIRHVSDAFAEDPVRVLRAARFAARYGFDIAPETIKLVIKLVCNGDLNHLTQERVWLEFEKAMNDHRSTCQFMTTLMLVGAVDVIAPEIKKGILSRKAALCIADNAHSSIAIKCSILTAHLPAQQAGEFWRNRFKAPNEVCSLASVSSMILSIMDHSWDASAQQLLTMLKVTDAFKENSSLNDVTKVIASLNEEHDDKIVMLNAAHHLTKSIFFSSLTAEQQTELKGKAIGEAIDKLKVKKIDSYLNLKASL